MRLNDYVRTKKEFPETVHLLVLRSVDIDSQLENNPETTLSLIHDTLKRIRVAIHKLKSSGFHDVVIATDHGFFLNAHAEAGDVCSKPSGTWVNVHERSLLGDGTVDNHSFVVSAEKAGIRGDFGQLAGPRSMAVPAKNAIRGRQPSGELVGSFGRRGESVRMVRFGHARSVLTSPARTVRCK